MNDINYRGNIQRNIADLVAIVQRQTNPADMRGVGFGLSAAYERLVDSASDASYCVERGASTTLLESSLSDLRIALAQYRAISALGNPLRGYESN